MKKLIFIFSLFTFTGYLMAGSPVITVRFANPELNCKDLTYTVDVEFQSNTADQRLFGMNVRFFYDDTQLEFISFNNFKDGYGSMSPNPPSINKGSNTSGVQLFGFSDAATYVNGAVQLLNSSSLPVYISTSDWTMVYSVSFKVVDLELFYTGDFSPSLIWDLQEDPSNGSFLQGSSGVVITVVAPPPLESTYSDETAVQFNWQYNGNTSAPFGFPVVTNSISPCLIMVANNDDFSGNVISSFEGGVAGNVLVNDLVNGQPPVAGQISLSIVDEGGINGVSLSYDGKLSIPPVTLGGNYSVVYRLSDYEDSDNYKDATVLVSVADPEFKCPADLVVCFNQGPVPLEGAVPGGGIYSGNGIINSVYEPSVAGIGTHFISYCIENPFTHVILCCDFTIQVTDGQLVSLSEGWNGISSYIMPHDPSMRSVLSPVDQSLGLIYNFEGIYWPEMGITTLNEWNPYSGYITKSINDVVLPVCGSPLSNSSLSMVSGWNLIPVLSAEPYNVEDLFSSLDITVAKDIAGTGVYWPAYQINTIGYFQPGKAYMVRLNSSGIADFGMQQKSSSLSTPEDINLLNTPWNAVTFTPETHLVAFNLTDNPLKTGDIVGGFTALGLCSGVTEVGNISTPFALTLFMDDIYTGDTDGFKDGEPISFVVYRPSTGELFDMLVSYNPSMNQGYFESNGLSEVNNLKLSSTGMIIIDTDQLQVFPNPTHGIFTLDGLAGNANIKVYNAYGKEVVKATTLLPHTFDISGIARGIYMIRISVDQKMYFRKLIIN
jgi:hypothetical protein